MLTNKHRDAVTWGQITLYSVAIGIVSSFIGLVASLLVPAGHPWAVWTTATPVVAVLMSVGPMIIRSRRLHRGQ